MTARLHRYDEPVSRSKALRHGLWLLLTWPLRGAKRLVALGWIVACFLIGSAQLALADGDGFINTPDYGSGTTVFERIPLTSYTVPFGLSDSQTDFPYVTEGMWQFFRGLTNVLIFISLALVKGAIAAMQWMLNLTIYRDQASEIDAAVQRMAGAVFWPMLGVTVAIAGATMYARMRREGDGSIFNDLVWVITATAIATTFAVAPAKIAGDLDNIRTILADRITQGFAATQTSDSAAGFPPVTVTSDDPAKNGSRSLGDSMWNVYGVAPWCYVAFGDLAICKDIGHDYLEDTDRWKALYRQQQNLNDTAADEASQCPAEYQSNCDWVRGQSFGRLGGALFMLVISIPLAVMLLALVVFGIMAVVGFLLLLLVGLIFLLFWMIPGRMRSIGMRWFEALIGTLLQAIIITALLGAVMVLAGIFNAALNKYGLFMVGLLNVATMAMVFKVRGMFENMTGFASPAGGGAISGYAAMKLTAGISRGLKGLAKGGAATAGYTGNKVMDGIGGAYRQVTDQNSGLTKAVHGLQAVPGQARRGAAVLRSQFQVPGQMPQPGAAGKPMAAATPYALAASSRIAIGANAYGPTATPMAPPAPAALPAGAQGGPRALPAAVSNSTTMVPGASGAGGQTRDLYVAGPQKHASMPVSSGGTVTAKPGLTAPQRLLPRHRTVDAVPSLNASTVTYGPAAAGYSGRVLTASTSAPSYGPNRQPTPLRTGGSPTMPSSPARRPLTADQVSTGYRYTTRPTPPSPPVKQLHSNPRVTTKPASRGDKA